MRIRTDEYHSISHSYNRVVGRAVQLTLMSAHLSAHERFPLALMSESVSCTALVVGMVSHKAVRLRESQRLGYLSNSAHVLSSTEGFSMQSS